MDLEYWHWLAIASFFFVLLERVMPWHRPHPTLRSGWLRDIGFLVLNGHIVAFVIAESGFATTVYTAVTQVLDEWNLRVDAAVIGDWPAWAQFVVFFVVADFVQWCTHVCLHKIPFLWMFHKVHHSIARLDWAANFHFHWIEIIVYRTSQALPLAFLGARPEITFWVFVTGTFWGHFNHANVPLRIGPLKYVFNSPNMHQWHHDASDEGGVGKNYGIVLSLWDWIFRTVHWPEDREPTRLGYPGDDEMPQNLGGQLLWPLSKIPPLRTFFRG